MGHRGTACSIYTTMRVYFRDVLIFVLPESLLLVGTLQQTLPKEPTAFGTTAVPRVCRKNVSVLCILHNFVWY